MGFFSFGSDLKEENKDLKAINKTLRTENEKFTEKFEEQERDNRDSAHYTERQHQLEVRRMQEKHEDELAEVTKAADKRVEEEQDRYNELSEEIVANENEEIEVLEEQISELNSTIRELTLKLDEKQADPKLAIRAATLDAREEAADEINDLQVKLATANASVATAKAEGNAKDIVIKALEKQLGVSDDRSATQFEALVDKLPEIALDKFITNIEVPAAPVFTQKGYDQQKK